MCVAIGRSSYDSPPHQTISRSATSSDSATSSIATISDVMSVTDFDVMSATSSDVMSVTGFDVTSATVFFYVGHHLRHTIKISFDATMLQQFSLRFERTTTQLHPHPRFFLLHSSARLQQQNTCRYTSTLEICTCAHRVIAPISYCACV
jgi:hypothetical protein